MRLVSYSGEVVANPAGLEPATAGLENHAIRLIHKFPAQSALPVTTQFYFTSSGLSKSSQASCGARLFNKNATGC